MSFAEECLELHNKYRELHNAPPLTLDETLVHKAEELVQVPLKGRALMESLYRPTYNINEFSIHLRNSALLEAHTVVDSWYHTRTKHDFRNNAPLRIPARFFTQMVWKSTTNFGMARVTSGDGKWWAVGVYYPAGNVGGSYLENVEDVFTPPPPPPSPKEHKPVKLMTPEQKARYDKAVGEYEAKKRRLDKAKKDSMCMRVIIFFCCLPRRKKR